MNCQVVVLWHIFKLKKFQCNLFLRTWVAAFSVHCCWWVNLNSLLTIGVHKCILCDLLFLSVPEQADLKTHYMRRKKRSNFQGFLMNQVSQSWYWWFFNALTHVEHDVSQIFLMVSDMVLEVQGCTCGNFFGTTGIMYKVLET